MTRIDRIGGYVQGFLSNSLTRLTEHLPKLSNASDWKRSLHDFQTNYGGSVATISTLAILVTRTCGARHALCFLAISSATYPLVNKHIHFIQDWLNSANNSWFIQTISPVALPILCAIFPAMAILSLPLQLRNAHARYLWDLDRSQKIQTTADQIQRQAEELSVLNTKNESSLSELKNVKKESEGLKQALLELEQGSDNSAQILKLEIIDLQSTNSTLLEKIIGLNNNLSENLVLIERLKKDSEEQTAATNQLQVAFTKQTASHEETMNLVTQVFAKYGIPLNLQENNTIEST